MRPSGVRRLPRSERLVPNKGVCGENSYQVKGFEYHSQRTGVKKMEVVRSNAMLCESPYHDHASAQQYLTIFSLARVVSYLSQISVECTAVCESKAPGPSPDVSGRFHFIFPGFV